MNSYSIVHMTVVFRENLAHQKVDALMGRIFQVTGPNAGTFLESKDILGKFENVPDPNLLKTVWGERKVLLLNISLGRDPKGHRVYLAPQVKSVRAILKGDTDILLIEANDVWATRLDQLDRLMRRLRGVGVLFTITGLLGLTYFWAFFLRGTFSVDLSQERKEKDPEKDQRSVFWATSDPKIETDIPETGTAQSVKWLLAYGSALGLIVGILSIAIIWSGHTLLYPKNLDPILVGSGWIEGDKNRLMLISLPAVAGVMGWFSGVFSRFLPFSY